MTTESASADALGTQTRTDAPASGAVRLSLVLSPDLNARLESIALATHRTKSEVLRRAIELYALADRERNKGHHIGFTTDSTLLTTEIVGL